MKKMEVRFERDPSLDRIEILIRGPAEDEEVTALLRQFRRTEPITFFDGDGAVRNIGADEIILASVMGKLVNVITADGSWYTRKTLQALEAELDESRFVRISRFEIVNLDQVTRYDFTVTGTLRLELTGGMETWASRRCIPAIRKRLMGKE